MPKPNFYFHTDYQIVKTKPKPFLSVGMVHAKKGNVILTEKGISKEQLEPLLARKLWYGSEEQEVTRFLFPFFVPDFTNPSFRNLNCRFKYGT